MDNSKLNPSSLGLGLSSHRTPNRQPKPNKKITNLVSFFSAFVIVLASVFMVNISTINTVEAKSKYSENKVKHKKYKKKYRKASYKKNKRYKKSKKKKYYKKRLKSKKSRKKKYYKKRFKSKKSRKYRKGKKYYKKYSKHSKRSKYKKARYSKKKSKRYKKKRRSRYITCDQLKSSVLRRKAKKYQRTIRHAAKTYGVSQNMIKAVITVETCFRSGLRGTSGEKGLMQLMPATAKRFGVKNRFSTWQNIHGGARYLSYLLRQYKGNKRYAAAAYNGGMGAVSKRTGPKFRAVRVYSAKVMNAYRKFNPLVMVKSKKRKSKKKKKNRL